MDYERARIKPKNNLSEVLKVSNAVILNLLVLQVIKFKLNFGFTLGVKEELSFVNRARDSIIDIVVESYDAKFRKNDRNFDEIYNFYSKNNFKSIDIANSPQHFQNIVNFIDRYLQKFENTTLSIIQFKISVSQLDSEILDLSLFSGVSDSKIKILLEFKNYTTDLMQSLDSMFDFYSQKLDILNNFMISTERSFYTKESIEKGRNQDNTYIDFPIFNFLLNCIEESNDDFEQMFNCSAKQVQILNIKIYEHLKSMVAKIDNIRKNNNLQN